MKAIETQYKGYRFRSRLEAKWAVFFEALGIKWEYEKEGYELPSGWYLPDFWLPEDGLWVEIKGELPTSRELQLAKELAEGTESNVFVFHGLPTQNEGRGFVFEPWDEDKSTFHEWNDVAIQRSIEGEVIVPAHRVVFISKSFAMKMGHFSGATLDLDSSDDDIHKAAQAAKSARFEHGESPDKHNRRRR